MNQKYYLNYLYSNSNFLSLITSPDAPCAQCSINAIVIVSCFIIFSASVLFKV